MAREEKPYRVYRGGRVKGKVPVPGSRSLRVQRRGADRGRDQVEYRGPGATPRGPRWGRRIALGVAVLLVLVIVWAVASWFAFSSGVSDADKRLDPNAKLALASQGGLVLSHSTTILMLGTDYAKVGGRAGGRDSASMMLLRPDAPAHR